jgi:hypothetical protein
MPLSAKQHAHNSSTATTSTTILPTSTTSSPPIPLALSSTPIYPQSTLATVLISIPFILLFLLAALFYTGYLSTLFSFAKKALGRKRVQDTEKALDSALGTPVNCPSSLLSPSLPAAPLLEKDQSSISTEKCIEKESNVARGYWDELADCCYDAHIDQRVSVQPPALPSLQFKHEKSEGSAMISLKAGLSSIWRRNRARRDTNASDIGPPSISTVTTTSATDTSDSLFQKSIRSSVTSITISIEEESDYEEAEVEISTAEVIRAQTQSMEVQKAVLLTWRASAASTGPAPEPDRIPGVSVSEDSSPSEIVPATESMAIVDTMLCPDVIVTTPSTSTFASASSSISVDLSEFPVPPV